MLDLRLELHIEQDGSRFFVASEDGVRLAEAETFKEAKLLQLQTSEEAFANHGPI